MAAKKPKGWNAFAKLARTVVQADKAKADAKMAEAMKRKRKKKK